MMFQIVALISIFIYNIFSPLVLSILFWLYH
ncbi:hypothetical protein [Campylobacter phage CJLB-7]|nr:hypothetical protein [Campylobacter phage CJLB-7]